MIRWIFTISRPGVLAHRSVPFHVPVIWSLAQLESTETGQVTQNAAGTGALVQAKYRKYLLSNKCQLGLDLNCVFAYFWVSRKTDLSIASQPLTHHM